MTVTGGPAWVNCDGLPQDHGAYIVLRLSYDQFVSSVVCAFLSSNFIYAQAGPRNAASVVETHILALESWLPRTRKSPSQYMYANTLKSGAWDSRYLEFIVRHSTFGIG